MLYTNCYSIEVDLLPRQGQTCEMVPDHASEGESQDRQGCHSVGACQADKDV